MKPALFVSHSKRGLFYYNDASARYRCVFPAEEIIANGGQAHAIHISQIDKITLSDYQTIVFHRPQYSAKLKRVVKKAQKQQIETWVDFDDLLFRPELSESSAAVQSGKMSASLARKHAKRYAKALTLFTQYQVSTDELADQLALHLGKSLKASNAIKISYNKIPERWVKQAEFIPAEKRLKKKIIRYLPGTSHHKHDFAHVEKFLADLLHNNPSYHLNIIGELEFDTSLFPSTQISRTAFQPFEQLPSLINNSWIIIAPLVDNVFNHCKSGLKFWESGVFGIPVISSPLRDIERFENEGLCISDNLNTWGQYLKSMANLEHYKKASNSTILASNHAIISQNTLIDHRLQYLTNTIALGPRWPALLFNPTSNVGVANNLQASSLPTDKLYSQALSAIANDIEPRSNTLLRKLKKLKNSPIQFLKDIRF